MELLHFEKLVDTAFATAVLQVEQEQEGLDYQCARMILNEKRIIYRKSKITPMKVGQFVTLWKRNIAEKTVPFHLEDSFEVVVIESCKEEKFGFFIFPKEALEKKGIVASKDSKGKNGFRLYPIWDEPQSRQAEQTQQWQLQYFIEGKDIVKAQKSELLRYLV